MGEYTHAFVEAYLPLNPLSPDFCSEARRAKAVTTFSYQISTNSITFPSINYATHDDKELVRVNI